MIKVLETAIEKVKALPPERQAYAAEILEHIVARVPSLITFPTIIGRALLRA